MFQSLVRPGAVSAVLLLGFGAAAMSESPEDQAQRLPAPALEKIAPELDMSTRQAASAHSRASSSASASASSRSSATAGTDTPESTCAAEAVVTTEVDGKRVTVRRSSKSTGGQEPCSAEVRLDARSGGTGRSND